MSLSFQPKMGLSFSHWHRLRSRHQRHHRRAQVRVFCTLKNMTRILWYVILYKCIISAALILLIR